MAFQLRRNSRVIAIGDSVQGGNGGTTATPHGPMMKAIAAQFGLPTVPTPALPFMPLSFGRPFIGHFDGAAARKAVDIANIAATFTTYLLAPQGEFNKAIIQLGINDAQAMPGETVPQFTTAATNIISGLLARYTQMTANDILWIGPWSLAAFPVNVPLVDTALTTLAASLGFNYLKWSTVPAADPVTGAAWSVGDNVHPNALGAAQLATQALTAISYA